MKRPRSSDWNYGGFKFRLSRSKIDLFTECPRCFYIDNKLGIGRPRGPAFTLNVAVDALLKKEFDVHRSNGTSHPLMKKYGVDAIPLKHENMDTWRENFEGIQHLHKPTGLIISGAIDDVWVNPKGELIIVDYKATAKDGKIEGLSDSGWESQYKRQMEIYQWLFRRAGFEVSDIGYFVYVNGKKDKAAFDGKLEFDVTLIPHKGSDKWVEGVILNVKACLDGGVVPKSSPTCEFCEYLDAREYVVKNASGSENHTHPDHEHDTPIKIAKKSKTSRVSKRTSKNTAIRRTPSLF